MPIKNRDFVQIEYIAKDQETSQIFDLTSENEAKKHNLYNPNINYTPIIICIGERQIIQGLDKFLVNKEINKEYTINLTPEEGFGKKDPKLIKLIPLKLFKKGNIRPFPGLQVNIDNLRGTVRSVSGGRITVDFNHPLAGHNLTYKIKVTKVITDNQIKVKSILNSMISNTKFELKDNKLEIFSNIPEIFQKNIKETILRTIPSLKEIIFKPIPKHK